MSHGFVVFSLALPIEPSGDGVYGRHAVPFKAHRQWTLRHGAYRTVNPVSC